MGTTSDCPGDSSRLYAQIAPQALAVADRVLLVGSQASASLHAKREAGDKLFAFTQPDLRGILAHTPQGRRSSTCLRGPSYVRVGFTTLRIMPTNSSVPLRLRTKDAAQ